MGYLWVVFTLLSFRNPGADDGFSGFFFGGEFEVEGEEHVKIS